MEYMLHNTDILDPSLAEKFNISILDDIHQFDRKNAYRFVVSFHVDLLKNSSRFDSFILPASNKITKSRKKDGTEKLSGVLRYQLNQLEDVLQKNNIELSASTIQGDQLESINTIKIEIEQDTLEPIDISTGGKKRPIIRSIMPNKQYTEGLIRKFKSERLSKLYYLLFDAVGNNKSIMSEILEIEETDDEVVLFQALVKEYGEIWFTTKSREEELIEKLINKALRVVEKYHGK